MAYQELRLVVVNMETGTLEQDVLTLARSNVLGAAACLMSHLEDMWGSDSVDFPTIMDIAEEVVADMKAAEEDLEYRCGICQLCFPTADPTYQYGACGIRVCVWCHEPCGPNGSCFCRTCTQVYGGASMRPLAWLRHQRLAKKKDEIDGK